MSHEFPETPQQTESVVLPSEQRIEDGVEKELYELEPGWYGVELGFPEISRDEKRWHHGGNDDVEYRQQNSFEFDTDHPLFQKMVAEMKEAISGATDVKQIPLALDVVVNKGIKSSMASEHCARLSDILMNGRGACASKTLVAGLLAQETLGARTGYVIGQYGPIKEKMSHPFTHAWLRFQIENFVFLYDPMYRKYQIVAFEGENIFQVAENYDFSKNGVAAYSLAGLSRALGANILNSPQIIPVLDYSDDASATPFLQQDTALSGQIFGPYADIYVPKKATFQTENGNWIQTNIPGSNPVDGPIIKYPMQKISRVS